MKTVPFEPLDPALYRETVRRALAEDLTQEVFLRALTPTGVASPSGSTRMKSIACAASAAATISASVGSWSAP